MTATISAASYRAQLVEQITAKIPNLSTPWRSAFNNVPREHFVRDFSFIADESPLRYQSDDPGYLSAVYRDADTSATVQPSIIAHMLQALDAARDRRFGRILEIGTGCGYTTALLCRRYGGDRIVTLDADDAVSRLAKQRLAETGFRPVAVDGPLAEGWDEFHGPYSALLAVHPVNRFPEPWFRQVVTGGVMVIRIGQGMVALKMSGPRGDRCAEGPFLAMVPEREHAPAAGDIERAMGEGSTSQVIKTPYNIHDALPEFLLSIVHPNVVRHNVTFDGQHATVLIDKGTDSWSRIVPMPNGFFSVESGGKNDLWESWKRFLDLWVESGMPSTPTACKLAVEASGKHRLIIVQQSGIENWLSLPA